MKVTIVYLQDHMVITCFVGGEFFPLTFKPWVVNLKHKIGKKMWFWIAHGAKVFFCYKQLGQVQCRRFWCWHPSRPIGGYAFSKDGKLCMEIQLIMSSSNTYKLVVDGQVQSKIYQI